LTLRLLLLTPEYASFGGGIATFYRGLLRSFSSLGHSVRVVEGSALATATSRNCTSLELEGVSTEQLETSRFLRWFENFGHLSAAPTFRRHLAAAWAMWEQALEGPDFDVVEATDWGLLGVPPVVVGSHPTILQAHASCGQIAGYDKVQGDEVSDILIRMVELAAMSAATEIQTYSPANAAFWAAQLKREVTMIRPAWSAHPRSGTSNISDRGLVIGRLQSWKGPETLCEALRLLGPRAPAVGWIGREVDWPRSNVSASVHLASRYPDVWGKRILHESPQAPDEVQRRQSQAMFNLVPSTWDVFNFTAVEAMVSGRPTIVSSGAGASELIEHGINGFVFPAGDPTGLAAAIDEVRSLSPERQAQIGENALETIRRELDPSRSAATRIARYQSAIEAHAKLPRTLSQWMVEACSPAANTVHEGAFLDRLPLQLLTRHVVRRAFKRLKP
jgi:glycosyltransferase involved in cell wall biosynthesis